MSKKRFQLPAWLNQPAYYAIRAAIATLGMTSVDDAVHAAAGLGRRVASLEPKRVQRAMDALAVAFPDMSVEQRRQSALLAYEHLFTLAIEMVFTPRLITKDAWSDRVRMGSLAPALSLLLQERPCVLITGHCGNWELLGYTLSLIGFPMHALYRPLDLLPLDTWLRQTRERQGLVLVDKFGAVKQLPALMHANARAAFIADQNAGDRGLFVPYFGRLASTYKSIGILAIQHDAPIICGQARRLSPLHDTITSDWQGQALHYRLDAIDVIYPEEWKSQPDPLFYVSARYRRALENMVRAAPEQNLWLHRYWKSRPRHEHTGKPFPPTLREKLRALPWMTSDQLARIEDWSARDAHTLATAPQKAS